MIATPTLGRRLTRGARQVALLAAAALATVPDGGALAQARSLTTPKQHFGFEIGDDYRLANYTQFAAYWDRLARESDRMELDTIGRTAEGRPQLMAIISSPANLARKERYRQIAERLARADGVDSAQARALAKEGKAIVWIDGGLHATETLGAHQLILTVWELVSKDDPETRRFLDDAIVLAVHANPDGMELVSNWYMREADSTKRTYATIPRLYQKYIGHDNNRDFYMVTQPETENMTRIQYRTWYPQIVFNHHQTGPEGSVLFAPPFRGPHNHNFDPLIPLGIDLVGSAIHNRFAVEGKPGAVMREEAGYQTWWNGGLRTTVYFHNMIGLLTETIGSPTPMRIPYVPRKQVATADNPNPIAPQEWRFRQSLAYSVSSNRAVLDVASKHREDFLFNIWRMGRNSIERGSRDEWTVWPRRVAALQEEIAKDRAEQQAQRGTAPGTQGRRSEAVEAKWYDRFRDPAQRDPRAYVIPADQPDFLTAVKFVNTLIKAGVDVHTVDAPLTVNGKRVPAGSFVVFTAQAFRPHVLDMFEPQDYPNDLQYPGGPPKAPYDNAGYTLAYQMGVRFERVLDALPGRFTKLADFAAVPAGTAAQNPGTGWFLGRATNDAVRAAQRLLAQGEEVWWLEAPVTANGRTHPAGTFYVPAKGSTTARVQGIARELGVSFDAAGSRPAHLRKLRRPRVALWDQYGGLMTSGWTRWILERFEVPFDVVHPGDVDGGALAKYDVVILPDGAASADGAAAAARQQAMASGIPQEFRGRLGAYTKEKTLPRLREFANRGGTILAIGSATRVGYDLELPVEDALVERTPTGQVRSLPREKLFIPGSVLRVAVDSTHPLAAGMGAEADVLFDTSPVFRLKPEAGRNGTRAVAWFASDRPLRSGWAWGQHHLADGVAVVDAPLGRGRVVLYGPEVLFRAQPHGTFKLFFNGLLTGSAERGSTAD